MNPVYYTNNNCIENYMPQVQKVLSAYTDFVIDESLQIGVDTVNGKPVLFAQRGEEVTQLDSIYDSTTLVKIWSKSLPELQRTRCMVFGFGNGMFLRELLHQVSLDSLVFVYEPSLDLFRFVLNQYDLEDILSDSRLTLVLPQMETPNRTFAAIAKSMLDYRDLEKIQYTEYFNYLQLFPYERDYFTNQISLITADLSMEKEFFKANGRLYVKNQLMLTSDLIFSESLASLKNHMPQDVTALLVIGNTGVAEGYETLMAAKGHSLIIAVDSVVDTLLSYGITPDLYISLRMQKPEDVLTDDRHYKIPVICSTYSDPSILKDHPGTVFFYGDDNPFLYQYLNREKIILPNLEESSAVCGAFRFLEDIAVSRIIIMGDNIIPKEEDTPLHTMENRELYLPWIESELSRNPDIHLINTLGTFSRILGSEELPFETAVATYCTAEFDFSSILSHSVGIFFPQQRSEFLDYVYVDYQKELLIVEEIATEIDQICKELLDIEKRGNIQDSDFRTLAERIEEDEIALEDSPYMHYPQVYCFDKVCELMDTNLTEENELESAPISEDREQNPLRDALIQHRDRNSLVRQAIIDIRALLEEYKTENRKRFHALQKKKEETFENSLFETAWRTIQGLFDIRTRKENFSTFPTQMDAIMDELQEKSGLEKFAVRILEDIKLMTDDLILQHMMILVFLYELMRDEKYLVMLEDICKANMRLKDEVRDFVLRFAENEPELDPEDSLLRFAQVLGISE